MARVVYVILNHETGQAYAGLTSQFKRRLTEHRRQKPYLFAGNHTVFKTESISDEAAQRFEAKAVRFLKVLGFRTVNMRQAGSLGGFAWCWSKDDCAAEALKYTTRKRFELGTKSAYTAAQRKGWLDEICGHMERPINVKGHWTKSRCAIEALKYSSGRQFLYGSGGAYVAARLHGWLTEICGHMKPRFHPKGYWTKARCIEEALKYRTRSEFMQGAKGAYNMTHRNGWIDEVCAHMTQLKRRPKPGRSA